MTGRAHCQRQVAFFVGWDHLYDLGKHIVACQAHPALVKQVSYWPVLRRPRLAGTRQDIAALRPLMAAKNVLPPISLTVLTLTQKTAVKTLQQGCPQLSE